MLTSRYIPHIAFVYVHKQTSEIKVLDSEDAAIHDASFDRVNWDHTASIHVISWLQYYMSANNEQKQEMIKELVTIRKETKPKP